MLLMVMILGVMEIVIYVVYLVQKKNIPGLTSSIKTETYYYIYNAFTNQCVRSSLLLFVS